MNLKLHNEGWVFVITSALLTIIIFPFFPILGLILLLFTFCFFYFFRDPVRTIPSENVVISPADGKIVFIGDSKAPPELNLKDTFIKLSIFLDVFNVHVNRIPISGKILDIKYVHGKFFRANVDKASKDNERNIILIENKEGEKIIVSQIAGLIARRIVCDLKINQEVIKGNKFGIIKFGSRVDIYLPNNYLPMVLNGQIVIGGESIIANPLNIQKLESSINI